MRDSDRIALRNFWESKYGPYGAFTYNAPNDDGAGTTAFTCRFANEPLSWQLVADWLCSIGVTLVEIPAEHSGVHAQLDRHPVPLAGVEDALLSQVQQVIPLIKIQPLQAGYPAIYLSDRRCTVGGQLYQARLIDFDGISQGMGNESDDASFTFGNADRVMRTSQTMWTCTARRIDSRCSMSGRASSSISGRATSSTGPLTPARSSRSPPRTACTN